MRLIDADALINYCNNLKDKTIDANDIARFPTVGGWISVKDRLPEDNVRVLVYSQTLKAMFVDKITDKKWWVLPEAYEVTHWLPLPEKPKEESNGNCK